MSNDAITVPGTASPAVPKALPRPIGKASIRDLRTIVRVVWGSGFLLRRALHAAFTPPFELRELLRQMDDVGSKSLPLVALAGGAIGAVLSMEVRSSMTRFGATSLLPSAVV